MPSNLKKYWNADPSNHKKLAELLREPVLITALAIVREEGRPKGSVTTAEALLAVNALENTRVFGWHQSLDALENLVNIKTPKKVVEQEPFLAEAEDTIRNSHLAPPNQP